MGTPPWSMSSWRHLSLRLWTARRTLSWERGTPPSSVASVEAFNSVMSASMSSSSSVPPPMKAS
eukprot:8718126-Lingulodinium_polyedra.AAC.1